MTNEDLLLKMNEEEIELAAGLSREIRRDGPDSYLERVKNRVYPIAEVISKMSPNELIVFEDALIRFRAVQDGNK